MSFTSFAHRCLIHDARRDGSRHRLAQQSQEAQMTKRRAHGEGGLFRRNRGTPRESWVARIYLEDGARKEVYAQTQAEAKRKLADLKRGAELGLALRSQRQTVGQFLVDWLENVAKPKLRPRSFRSYRRIVGQYLVPRLGHVQLAKITPQHVQSFQNERWPGRWPAALAPS